jgi:hypothetical protein
MITYALYGMLLVSCALALVRPVWALVAVVVVELSLYGYIPGTPISTRLGTALAAGLLALPLIAGLARRGDGRLRLVLLPAALFVAVATVVNLFYSDFGYVFKYARWQVLQIMALVVAAAVIRDRRDLKTVVGITLALALLSALVAIWQHVSPHSAPYNGVTAEQLAGWGGRVVGLVKSPVILANQLTFVLMPAIGLLVCGPHRFGLLRAALVAAILTLLAGLYYTYTRSALMALGPGLLTLAVYTRGPRRAALIGAIIAMPLLYVLLQGTGLIGDRYEEDLRGDKSAASHLGMLQVGVEVALDNWLVGIGHEWFEEESTAYRGVVTSDVVQAGGAGSIGEGRVHNDFLNAWFSWGIAGLLAFLAIFVGTVVNLNTAARSRDSMIRGLAAGATGGMVAFAFSSAFHNYLDSSAVLWLYAGLSVTLVRLAKVLPVAERRMRQALVRGPRPTLRSAAQSVS